jgi:HK97 family phage major capsid protein
MKIGDVTHDEGEIVHLDDELAGALTDAGVVRDASDEDLYTSDDEGAEGPDEEKEEDEEDKDEEEAEEMTNAVRRLANNAEATVTKAVEDVTDRLVKATRRKPFTAPYAGGSDEAKTGGFKSIGDFASNRIAAKNGDYNAGKKVKRWAELVQTKYSPTAMGISASHAGSDLVPQQWAEELWKLSFANVPDLMGMQTKYEMKYQIENIPSWVQSSATSDITASVVAEGSAITATTGVTATVQLTLQKGAVLVNITDELLRFNAYHLGSVIEQVVPERIRYLVNDSVVNGTSSGVNLINNAAAVSIIASNPGRIEYTDIVNMEAALFDEFDGENTVWLCNKATLPELYTVAFPNRAATTPIPAWTPGGFNDMLGAKPKGSLLGRPVYTLENVPTKGTRGALILANLKSLAAGYTTLEGDHTPYLYFNQAIDTWRFLFYFNTVNPLTVPYQRKDGSYASNIVVLTAGSTSSS